MWWKVKDLDSAFCRDNEPVKLLGEEYAIDWGVTVALGEPLSIDNVPDHNHAIAGSRCEVCRVFDDVKSGNLSLVTSESVHERHVQIVPHLDGLVPGGSDADGRFLSMVESDARDGILVLSLINGMFAFRASVPDLDILIESAGNNLSVVS